MLEKSDNGRKVVVIDDDDAITTTGSDRPLPLSLMHGGESQPPSMNSKASFLVFINPSFLSVSKPESPKKLDMEEGGECSKRVVSALYQALSSMDVDTVHSLLAPDLEWWFHGPPTHQHLMRLLTGSHSSFSFLPISTVAFGSTVVAEGFDVKDSSVCWVHAWSVSDGRITLLKEFFNTSVTVARFGNGDRVGESDAKAKASSCQSLWQSKVSDESAPGLVLAL